MKTVDKAMTVLGQFSLERTEIGLSDLSRLADLDKAATRRLLIALAKHGFIEQVAETRKYRLGHGFLRLARIREATVPITQAAQEICDWLVKEVDETVHISVPGEDGMVTIAHRLPKRGNVINIIPSQVLHYHATASGLAFLAFASDETAERILKLRREKITDATVISKSDLKAKVREFKAQGYAQTQNTFELDVASVAMPFFGDATDPQGTIALALHTNDMTHNRRDELLALLSEAISGMERTFRGL